MSATTAALREHAPREVPAPVPVTPAAAAGPARLPPATVHPVFAASSPSPSSARSAPGCSGTERRAPTTPRSRAGWSASARASSGQVEKVRGHRQPVGEQGDLLVQLDTKDLDAKLASARADVESARAGLASALVSLRLTQCERRRVAPPARGGLTRPAPACRPRGARSPCRRPRSIPPKPADRLAQADWAGRRSLAKAEAISRRISMPGRSRAEQARAALEQARARLATAPRPTSPPRRLG
jgi:hypothetical protein